MAKYPQWYRIPKLVGDELPGWLQVRYFEKGGTRYGPYMVWRFRDADGKEHSRSLSADEAILVADGIGRRRRRLARQRRQRDQRMRRGMGRGFPAHLARLRPPK